MLKPLRSHWLRSLGCCPWWVRATWATSPGTLYEGCSRLPSQNTSMTHWPTEVAQDHENDSVWSSTSLNQVNLETSSYSSFSWRCGFKHSWLPKNLCLGFRSNLIHADNLLMSRWQQSQAVDSVSTKSASDLVEANSSGVMMIPCCLTLQTN